MKEGWNNQQKFNCLKPFKPILSEISCQNNLFMKGTKIILPKMMRPEAL